MTALVVVVAAWSCGAGPVAASSPEAVAFGELRASAATARERRQVLLVYFTAEWCTWCRQMERVTFRDEDVVRQSSAFAWAKVDVDAQPQISGAFGVRGVPALAVLNADGELLDMQAGYLNPQRLVALLGEYADQAEAPGRIRRDLAAVTQTARQLEEADDDQVEAQVLAALELLTRREVVGQRVAEQGVVDLGPRAWPALVAALGDERLAMRAAAYDLLEASSGAGLAFDPFADAEQRSAEAARWRQWVGRELREPEAGEAGEAADG